MPSNRKCAAANGATTSALAYNIASADVQVGLYKGNILFQKLTNCRASLYNPADSSMEKSEGLNPVSSQGFVEVQAVEARSLARAGQIR